MKREITLSVITAMALSMASLTANGSLVIYNGTISASSVGSSVTTDLPLFNGALGTLESVQVTLDFVVTPYGEIYNFSGASRTFDPASFLSFSYAPSDTWTITHGTDSWSLAAPTVTTGTFYGTGQVVPNLMFLTFPGSTSAPADLTASGLNLAAYTGAGSLVFGTAGPGQSLGGGPFFSGGGFVGGGGNLAGTASVTYTYAPVPEPATLAVLGLGAVAMMLRKRQS